MIILSLFTVINFWTGAPPTPFKPNPPGIGNRGLGWTKPVYCAREEKVAENVHKGGRKSEKTPVFLHLRGKRGFTAQLFCVILSGGFNRASVDSVCLNK